MQAILRKSRVALRLFSPVAAVMLTIFPAAAQQQPTPAAPQNPPAQTVPMPGATGQPGMMGGQGGMQGMGQMPARGSGPATPAMMQSMQKMQQSMMSAPVSGDADRDFVAMMMPHHQDAIDMARTEIQYGKDPLLRRMAHGIISPQEKEIREMQQWQAKHPVRP